MVAGDWDVYLVDEVRQWLDTLDASTHARVVQAIDLLAEHGPGLGRPLVDTIHGSSGRWKTWYQEAIPVAEHRYELYLKDRAREEGKA